VGEYTSSQGCRKCSAPDYAFDPQATSCARCPEGGKARWAMHAFRMQVVLCLYLGLAADSAAMLRPATPVSWLPVSMLVYVARRHQIDVQMLMQG
jgi:hypothetical protein